MNLTQLELRNYRRFDDLTISFHPELTVIVARNGQGKPPFWMQRRLC